MRLNEVTSKPEERKYGLYFNSGRGKPKLKAGPFDSIKEANEYADKHHYDLKSSYWLINRYGQYDKK